MKTKPFTVEIVTTAIDDVDAFRSAVVPRLGDKYPGVPGMIVVCRQVKPIARSLFRPSTWFRREWLVSIHYAPTTASS
jgi:hypothetical protein